MSEKRSNCPIATVLDIVGDRWTLLVIRDIAILGKKSFSELSASAEHIPPSTLSARLELLVRENLVTKSRVTGGPGRQYCYELTKRGTDLIPVLAAMTHWSARHDPDTPITPALAKRLQKSFGGVAETLQLENGFRAL